MKCKILPSGHPFIRTTILFAFFSFFFTALSFTPKSVLAINCSINLFRDPVDYTARGAFYAGSFNLIGSCSGLEPTAIGTCWSWEVENAGSRTLASVCNGAYTNQWWSTSDNIPWTAPSTGNNFCVRAKVKTRYDWGCGAPITYPELGFPLWDGRFTAVTNVTKTSTDHGAQCDLTYRSNISPVTTVGAKAGEASKYVNPDDGSSWCNDFVRQEPGDSNPWAICVRHFTEPCGGITADRAKMCLKIAEARVQSNTPCSVTIIEPTSTPTPTLITPSVTPTVALYDICDNKRCVASTSASGIGCTSDSDCIPHGPTFGQCTSISPSSTRVAPGKTITVRATALPHGVPYEFGWGARRWIGSSKESSCDVNYSDNPNNPAGCLVKHQLAPTTWDIPYENIVADSYCHTSNCWVGVQGFTPGATGVLDKVEVFVRGAGTINMAVYDMSESRPLTEDRGSLDDSIYGGSCTDSGGGHGCWLTVKFARPANLQAGRNYYLKMKLDDMFKEHVSWAYNGPPMMHYFKTYMRGGFSDPIIDGVFSPTCSVGQPIDCTVSWTAPDSANAGDKYTIGADVHTNGFDLAIYGEMTNSGLTGVCGWSNSVWVCQPSPQACFTTVTIDYNGWFSSTGGGSIHANSDIREVIPTTAVNPPGRYLTANGSPGGVVSTTKTLSLGAGQAGAGSKNWRVTSYGNGSFNIDGMELNSTGRFYDTILENLSGKLPAGYSVTGPVSWSGNFTSNIENTTSGQQKGVEVGDGIVWNINGDLNISGNASYQGNKHVLVLVSGKITVGPQGSSITNPGGAIVFVSRNGVEIQSTKTQGPAYSMDGVFLTDGNFATTPDGTGDDKQLTGKGMWMVSRGGSFSFGRDLGSVLNRTTPAEYLTFDPKYLVLMEDILGQSSYSWIEVNPD